MKKKIMGQFLVSIFLLTACISLSTVGQTVNPYCQGGGKIEAVRCQLAQAQQKQDLAQIKQKVAQFKQLLGSSAGVPDEAATFKPVPANAPLLTREQVKTAFTPYGKRIEQEAWWRGYPQPSRLKAPLRSLATVITGTLAARRAGGEYGDRLLKIARETGDYLIWAQGQGGRGLYPFPVAEGTERAFQVAQRFLTEAKKQGKLAEVLHNGWIVNDLGGGDLQFDNGVCGVALLELYQATGEKQYLDSALAAANWAIAQPVVPNWNYNSFSVFLLAKTYQVTQESRYLNSAKEKARLGIYPGQLQTGVNKGRWLDPHNARLVYHYILIRGLGALVSVLPNSDPDLPGAVQSLTLALQVANGEIIEKGVTYPDTVLEVLSRLRIAFPNSSGRLQDRSRTAAFDRLGRFASSLYLEQKKLPVTPDAWGLFLETISGKAS